VAVRLELPLPQVPLESGPRLQPGWPGLRLGPALLGLRLWGSLMRQADAARAGRRCVWRRLRLAQGWRSRWKRERYWLLVPMLGVCLRLNVAEKQHRWVAAHGFPLRCHWL
jgi:hypothetical protein